MVRIEYIKSFEQYYVSTKAYEDRVGTSSLPDFHVASAKVEKFIQSQEPFALLKKYGAYAYQDRGVYKDDKGILYDQKTKRPIIGQLVSTTEKAGNIELQKSLKTDSDGKLTTEIAKTQIKVNGQLYDIDSQTYNALIKSKGKGVEKPTYIAGKLKISIGNTEITFEKYSVEGGKETGTKTTEQFRTAYFYEGREITTEEYKKLKEEEKNKVEIRNDLHAYKQTEVKEKDELKYSTTYKFRVEFDKDKSQTNS